MSTPLIGTGQVRHTRLRPSVHAFAYPTWFVLLPMRHIAAHGAGDLAVNRRAWISFHDQDHGDGRGPETGGALAWLDELLLSQGILDAHGEVWLHTYARVMGHVFNPVSFWYCHRTNNELAAIVVEVNNTFGERHCYVLPAPRYGETIQANKVFYVSPFCEVKGQYAFRFMRCEHKGGQHTVVRIDHSDAQGALIRTSVSGQLFPLTDATLRHAFWRYPMHNLNVVWRIHWQALKLWLKKVPLIHKPNLQPTPTMPSSAKRAVHLLKNLHAGGLKLGTPDGQTLFFGQPTGPQAELQLHNWKVFDAALRSGDIGFAQSYIAGDWDTPDLTALLEILIINRRPMDDFIFGSWWGRLAYQVRHWLRRNTKANSSKNIHAHYDLGNAFYSLWLDPTMTYSSAWFNGDRTQVLAAAQQAKVRRALHMAGVMPGQKQRVLEIGCGWGGLAEIAIREFDAQLTGITLSPAQLAYATERLHAQSMHADLRLQDYRDTNDGPYDAICSIEMIEAVGQEFWPDYFQTIARLLKPGGQACIQSIVIDDALFERYAMGTDFIQQYIFPGGFLPSTRTFIAQAEAAGLQVVDQLSFGQDYAETLRRWREAFLQALPSLPALGFDRAFERTWLFYLAYCEAAFAQHNTNVIQFTLRKST